MIRLLFLFTIGSSAWPDGAKLECDTNTPGCEKLCINHFYPLAPVTFWSLQVLFVCLPAVIFMVYAEHIESKIKFCMMVRSAIRNDNKKKALKFCEKQKCGIKEERERLSRKRSVADDLSNIPNGSKIDPEDAIKWLDQEESRINQSTVQMDKEINEMIKAEKEESKKAIDASGGLSSTPPKLLLAYGTMVFFRILIEILFVVLYFRLYSFDMVMPEKYQCEHVPCNNVVACYIDRPKQKTFTICFIMASVFMTIFAGLVELWSIGLSNYVKAFQNRHKDVTKEYNRALVKIYTAYTKRQAIIEELKEQPVEHAGM